MSEIVDRVARAIVAAGFEAGVVRRPWDELEPSEHEGARDQARAAIRELSPEKVKEWLDE